MQIYLSMIQGVRQNLFMGILPVFIVINQATNQLCPLRKAKEVNLCYVPRLEIQLPMQMSRPKSQYAILVLVNGQVATALLDTGSSQTLVKTKFVDNESLNFGNLVGLGCVYGEEPMYPTAVVDIGVDGQVYMTVGVVDQLVCHFGR